MPNRNRSVDGSDRRSIIADNILTGQNQAMRQMEQMRNIQEENDTLKKEIAGLSGANYDYVKADKLAVLQGEVDALERRYQFEKMRKNDLIKRYQLARIDLLHSRKMKGGVNVEKEHADAVARQVSILENRLDQALCKFNDALSYNKELRDQIDIIRGERRVFQRVHKKLDEDLRMKKRVMAERLEQSNRDMDERDEYVRHVEQLKLQIAQQEAEYRDQVRQLDVAMVEIKILRDEQTSMQLELEGREYELEIRLSDEEAIRQMESMTPAGSPSKGSMPPSRPDLSDDDLPHNDQLNVLSVDKEVFTITDIITQIRDATHEDNLERLRDEFQFLGDNNFSLYKKINQLTTMKEELADEIQSLHLLIQEDNDAEAKQRKLIKDLEEKLAMTESQLEGIRTSITRQRDALAIALGTTEDVYTRVGCDKLPTHNPQDICTESNLLVYLGSIEERATQVLIAFQHHNRVELRRMELIAERGGIPALPPPHRGRESSLDAPLPDGEPSPKSGELTPISIQFSFLESELHVEPALPLVPATEHNAVSAQRIVRQNDLPHAHLGAENHSLMSEYAEDKVVSHEEIRKQMELRLISKRDREERAARRRREKEAAVVISPTRRTRRNEEHK